MLRPVLGSLTIVAVLMMLADDPVMGQGKGGKKHNHHEATIVKVNATNHTIEVDIHEKAKKKHQHFKLAASVKVVDKQGHVIKLEVFKKGDQVKIVESEGTVHELHHKGHKGKGTGKGDKKKG